jgi:flagellar basal body L-ring protein FlgH
MKHLFLFLALAITLASCNSAKNLTNSVQNFADKHNFQETHSFNVETGKSKISASIDTLYDYSKVAAMCDTLDITLHISRASINAEATCDGAGEKLVAILKKAFAAIEFLK